MSVEENGFALCTEKFVMELALDVAVLLDPCHGNQNLSEDAKTALDDLRRKLDRSGALDDYKQQDGAIRCATFWPVIAPPMPSPLLDRRSR